MANIMVQGTTSSAGKSLLVTGLCRIFKEDGHRVAPFKSQNMSSNYYENSLGEKMSHSQALQALAAGLKPSPRMNPILLVPRSDSGSLVVIRGQEKEAMEAKDYFKYRRTLKELVLEEYRALEEDFEILVLEGAGSPAEINLRKNDLVNMGLAEMVDAPVILVADIDRGGVFASLYGTIMLLEPKERARVRGLVINKFRGDKKLLEPGLEMFRAYVDLPVLGVLPYIDLDFGGEDNFTDEKKLEEELEKLTFMLRKNLDLDFIYKLVDL